MNILITGGCGFIGSNFINIFFEKLTEDDRLINIDAMYYCANEESINKEIRESSRYHFIIGNLRDFQLLEEIIDCYQITHVIHFAAQSHVQNSFDNAIQFTYDNILGTHVLLEVCRRYGKIQKFIHCSTDETYGESMLDENEKHKTEESILCPSNPYAATKAAAELLAQSYYHSFKMPICITRGNNTYGGKNKALQYPEKLIPRFIKLLSEDKKVTIQGSGSQVRAFLNVYDTVKAFEVILEKGVNGEIYNIGCDDELFRMEYSVMEISEMLIRKIKGKDVDINEWIEFIEDRPFNDSRYFISNHKLKELGWNITIKFEDGICQLLNDMGLLK